MSVRYGATTRSENKHALDAARLSAETKISDALTDLQSARSSGDFDKKASHFDNAARLLRSAAYDLDTARKSAADV